MRRVPSLVVVLAAATMFLCPRPGFASVETAPSFEQVAQAWMGAVALLAHDGDEHGSAADEHDRDNRHGHHRPPHHPHGHHGHTGPGRGPGPHAVVAKMDDILARLGRIEAKLDGRAGGPPRSESREPRPMARPEIPAEVREQMRQRMEEGRERMDEARQAFRQMQERIKKLEAEIERLKADR